MMAHLAHEEVLKRLRLRAQAAYVKEIVLTSAEVLALLETIGLLQRGAASRSPERRLVVTDSKGNGLYADEVCDAGTCCRPPGHSGRHDQFDGPRSADSVPFHHIGSSE